MTNSIAATMVSEESRRKDWGIFVIVNGSSHCVSSLLCDLLCARSCQWYPQAYQKGANRKEAYILLALTSLPPNVITIDCTYGARSVLRTLLSLLTSVEEEVLISQKISPMQYFKVRNNSHATYRINHSANFSPAEVVQ